MDVHLHLLIPCQIESLIDLLAPNCREARTTGTRETPQRGLFMRLLKKKKTVTVAVNRRVSSQKIRYVVQQTEATPGCAGLHGSSAWIAFVLAGTEC
jgi:hypothetical protein